MNREDDLRPEPVTVELIPVLPLVLRVLEVHGLDEHEEGTGDSLPGSDDRDAVSEPVSLLCTGGRSMSSPSCVVDGCGITAFILALHPRHRSMVVTMDVNPADRTS